MSSIPGFFSFLSSHITKDAKKVWLEKMGEEEGGGEWEERGGGNKCRE